MPKIDEYTQMEMIKTNGVYEWGFDLTDFNPNGKEKFQNLMEDFGMEAVPDEKPQFFLEEPGRGFEALHGE